MSSLRVSSKRKFVFKNCLQKSFWIKKKQEEKKLHLSDIAKLQPHAFECTLNPTELVEF